MQVDATQGVAQSQLVLYTCEIEEYMSNIIHKFKKIAVIVVTVLKACVYFLYTQSLTTRYIP